LRPRSEQPVPVLILRELETGPATIHDLAEVIGISKRNLREYLKQMIGIHICGWEQRTGPALPVWCSGEGINKRKPNRRYKRYENR
jgi:AraC-like DNA-binding protein